MQPVTLLGFDLLHYIGAMRFTALLIVTLTLSACVTTSEVTPMGRDTFMVSTDARGGFTSSADLTAKSAQKANAYCAAMGKEMSPDSVQNSGVRGFTPQENTFMFRCLAAEDPDNSRPKLRLAPNVRIGVER